MCGRKDLEKDQASDSAAAAFFADPTLATRETQQQQKLEGDQASPRPSSEAAAVAIRSVQQEGVEAAASPHQHEQQYPAAAAGVPPVRPPARSGPALDALARLASAPAFFPERVAGTKDAQRALLEQLGRSDMAAGRRDQRQDDGDSKPSPQGRHRKARSSPPAGAFLPETTLADIDIPDYVHENMHALTFPAKLILLITHLERLNSKSGKRIETAPIGWLSDGKSFMIRDPDELCAHWIPLFFGETAKIASFARKLYRWGFRKAPQELTPQGMLRFSSENFVRDDPTLVSNMRSTTARDTRRKQAADKAKVISHFASAGVAAPEPASAATDCALSTGASFAADAAQPVAVPGRHLAEQALHADASKLPGIPPPDTQVVAPTPARQASLTSFTGPPQRQTGTTAPTSLQASRFGSHLPAASSQQQQQQQLSHRHDDPSRPRFPAPSSSSILQIQGAAPAPAPAAPTLSSSVPAALSCDQAVELVSRLLHSEPSLQHPVTESGGGARRPPVPWLEHPFDVLAYTRQAPASSSAPQQPAAPPQPAQPQVAPAQAMDTDRLIQLVLDLLRRQQQGT